MSELPVNRFKQAIGEGRRQIGLWSSLRSPIVADVLRESGFDWIVLDTEHAPNEVPDIQLQLTALRGGTATPVIRPAWNDQVLFKRFLDVGAQSLLVPMVDSAEQAAAAVAATRYPPQGIRGVATAIAANRYARVPQYHQRANAEICVLVQVETATAMANIDAIAATEGVDGVFIGPSDLAAALGHLGNSGHAEVQDAIAHLLERTRRAGRPAGILTPDEALARRYLEMGFTFVAVGADVGLLARQSEALAARFKEVVTGLG